MESVLAIDFRSAEAQLCVVVPTCQTPPTHEHSKVIWLCSRELDRQARPLKCHFQGYHLSPYVIGETCPENVSTSFSSGDRSKLLAFLFPTWENRSPG